MENKITEVSRKVYRELIMSLNERISKISDDSIHIVEKDNKAAVNWCSIGAQHAEEAEKFGALLIKAASMAENFNDLIKKAK